MSNTIAIIPARGGSKRIPRKNIKEFLGKPIIAYSIEAAIKSELFNEVMVSTDDREIAEVAKRYGANIPFMRSNKNSNDFATTADVLLEVLSEYKKIGYEFDYVCCIYPTALFVTTNTLLETYKLLIEKKADSVLPVVKYSYPIQRSLKINDEGIIEFVWPEYANIRSQDLEPCYHDAGQFYWIKIDKFVHSKSIMSKKTYPFILREWEVQDIDTEEDFTLAKIKYKFFNRSLNDKW